MLEICVLVEIHCLKAAVSFHSITQETGWCTRVSTEQQSIWAYVIVVSLVVYRPSLKICGSFSEKWVFSSKTKGLCMKRGFQLWNYWLVVLDNMFFMWDAHRSSYASFTVFSIHCKKITIFLACCVVEELTALVNKILEKMSCISKEWKFGQKTGFTFPYKVSLRRCVFFSVSLFCDLQVTVIVTVIISISNN